ncbi:MAG: hypothetical protein COA74_14025 [Gammaproteobacteria bacterium]|nr:MAG: hypothetical protein COA74_14025 [Gammaproteobacteria bacterium]
MNNSIESIWEKGFLKQDALVAPQVNNLYDKKSIHIIDKLKKMFKINLQAIVFSSLVILAVTLIIGVPVLGILFFILLNWLVVKGYKEMKKLNTIDKSVSSYQFLKSFDRWMKVQIEDYTRFYKLFYPLFFLSFIIGIYFSTFGDMILAELLIAFPNSHVLFGMPLFVVIIFTVITTALGIFAGALYRLDVNLVYGNTIRKLDEIINDMEELRN